MVRAGTRCAGAELDEAVVLALRFNNRELQVSSSSKRPSSLPRVWTAKNHKDRIPRLAQKQQGLEMAQTQQLQPESLPLGQGFVALLGLSQKFFCSKKSRCCFRCISCCLEALIDPVWPPKEFFGVETVGAIMFVFIMHHVAQLSPLHSPWRHREHWNQREEGFLDIPSKKKCLFSTCMMPSRSHSSTLPVNTENIETNRNQAF